MFPLQFSKSIYLTRYKISSKSYANCLSLVRKICVKLKNGIFRKMHKNAKEMKENDYLIS